MIALIDGDKYCSKCFSIKAIKDFSFDKSSKDGHSYWCKKCASTNSRLNHRKRILKGDVDYKQLKRNAYIKNRHGISLQEYNAKLAAQNNECAICGMKLPNDGPLTHLDHCHNTGKLRAFLCTNCNRGLGHFQDSTDNLQKAIDYLNSHNGHGIHRKDTVNDSSH